MILIGLLAVFALALINAAPLAFFAMLFLGNLDAGVNYGFLALLPGAMAVKALSGNLITFNKTK